MKSCVIDMHCDTLMHAFLTYGDQKDIYEMPSAMIDLKRLLAGGAMAQFFAIFMLPQNAYREFLKREPIPDEIYIAGCAKVFETSITAHQDYVAKALNAQMIEKNACRQQVRPAAAPSYLWPAPGLSPACAAARKAGLPTKAPPCPPGGRLSAVPTLFRSSPALPSRISVCGKWRPA